MGSSAGQLVTGTLGVIAAPFTGGLSLALTAGALGAYQAGKAAKGQREAAGSLDQAIATPPTPPPAATPATLAQAAASQQASRKTNAIAGSSATTARANAAGTIATTPEGLQSPVQTANLTLLGGTK